MVRGVKFAPQKNRLYLTLSYKQQYKIAFNAYLFYPFLSVQNNVLIHYSDNTIVSTPYIMDNIMKFHPFAFSIHNLELFPEILSTNKSPELRFFIEELIRYLSNNFVRETEVGLFQYKFFDKVHNEISYLSKISAEESAAFNFSLDENYSTKTHIAAKIVLLRSIYKDFKKKDNSSVESLMFLNDMLGDSQLFDEYYDDAIIALSDIIHDVPIPVFKAGAGASIEFFLLWMRVKLKIAMVFEKMKHYDMAIGHLGVAMDASVTYLKEIKNLKENEKTPLYRELLYITQQAILNCLYVQEKFGEGITFIKLERYVSLFLEIEESKYYQKYRGRDMLLGVFYSQIGILLYFKNKTLPLWKSIEIHEIAKESNKKISKQKIVKEISKIKFFKLLGDSENLLLHSSYTELYDFFNFNEDIRRDFRFSFTTYITYKKSLMTFLAISPSDDTKGGEFMLKNIIATSIEIIRGDRFKNVHNSRKLIAIANILTRITDLLLTLYKNSEDNNIENEYLYELINNGVFNENENHEDTVKQLDKLLLEENKSQKPSKLVSISNIIQFYYLAGRFYIKAGRNVAFMFQLKKILLVFQTTKFIDLVAEKSEVNSEKSEVNSEKSEVNSEKSEDNAEKSVDKRKNYERLFEVLVNKILEINSWNANNSDGPQLTIINRVLGFKNRDYRYDLIKHLSNNPDTKEAIILFFSLKPKLNSYNTKDWNELLKILRKELQITSQSNSIAHQSIRVMELSLQLRINHILIKKYFTKKKLVILEENKSISISNTINPDDFKRYTELITNSLFCINQIITISSIYGINYMQSYSYFGSFYHKMGHWVKHYKECIKLLDISNNDKLKEIIENMNEDLKVLIGNTILQNLGEPCDYYQMALQYYHKAIQMHSEGSPYREQMNNMIFSEDDYSDNLSHFGAAIERQMINSGRLREKIDKLSKEVERSC